MAANSRAESSLECQMRAGAVGDDFSIRDRQQLGREFFRQLHTVGVHLIFSGGIFIARGMWASG